MRDLVTRAAALEAVVRRFVDLYEHEADPGALMVALESLWLDALAVLGAA